MFTVKFFLLFQFILSTLLLLSSCNDGGESTEKVIQKPAKAISKVKEDLKMSIEKIPVEKIQKDIEKHTETLSTIDELEENATEEELEDTKKQIGGEYDEDNEVEITGEEEELEYSDWE